MPAELSRRQRAALGLAGVAAAVLLLEALIRSGVVDATYVPPPSVVLLRLAELVTDPSFLAAVGDTLRAWALTIVASSSLAIPVGILLGSRDPLYRAAASLIELLRPIPSVALLPVAILLLGLGTGMKVALASYAVFWPLLINTMYGVRNVDRVMLFTARSLRWSSRRIMTRVTLPSAAPSIATGLRIASAVALIVVLTSEILAARSGLGSVIRFYSEGGRRELVYAGILLTGVLGLLVNFGFSWMEGRLLHWTPGQRRG